MGTVGVGIGHDNDLVIVGIFKREVCSDTRSDGINRGIDFLILRISAILALAVLITLPRRGKIALELTVTTLFGRTTG